MFTSSLQADSLSLIFSHSKTAGKAEGTGWSPSGSVRQRRSRPPHRHCPAQPPPTSRDPPGYRCSIAGPGCRGIYTAARQENPSPCSHNPSHLKITASRWLGNGEGGSLQAAGHVWASLPAAWSLLSPNRAWAEFGFFLFVVEISSNLLLLAG